METVGRFAPSPTGPLHLGNLRTALLAYLATKARDGKFLLRFEDLDRVTSSARTAITQQFDLQAIGILPDAEPVFQSERFDLYDAAIATLQDAGLTYECYCSRREIREAASAPHDDVLMYPGTCRDLSEAERSVRRSERPPAIRLRADGKSRSFRDSIAGDFSNQVDDVVLRRNDGVPSYNIAVVVDDHLQGVTQVVRGFDLLSITPTQIYLQELLGYSQPEYIHVPLVLGSDGERLAKRHGAITLGDFVVLGASPSDVRNLLMASLGQSDDQPFDLSRVPRESFLLDY